MEIWRSPLKANSFEVKKFWLAFPVRTNVFVDPVLSFSAQVTSVHNGWDGCQCGFSSIWNVLRMIVVNYITANHRFLRAACRCEAVSEAALKSKPCISKSKNKFSFHVFWMRIHFWAVFGLQNKVTVNPTNPGCNLSYACWAASLFSPQWVNHATWTERASGALCAIFSQVFVLFLFFFKIFLIGGGLYCLKSTELFLLWSFNEEKDLFL